MTIDILGIDLAKNVFQLHGVDRKGNAVFKRRVMRDQLLSVLAGIEPCTIAIEACTGAFCWARQFEELGYKVKIVSPQYVKPFVRRQKTMATMPRRSARLSASHTSLSCQRSRSSNKISRRCIGRGSVWSTIEPRLSVRSAGFCLTVA